MEFVKHEHPLILYDHYYGGEDDAGCYLCGHQFYSALAYSVYRCSTRERRSSLDECSSLILHKSCAELPVKLTDYFMHPQHPLTLVTKIRRYYFGAPCSICSHQSSHMTVYSCELCQLSICLKCVTSPLVYHGSHKQHALALVQRSASFCCDACGKEASSSSSCKCSSCPYWIHISCALLSSSFQSKFHSHPLLLAYSFPKQYLNFKNKCKVCKDLIKPTLWLYYCAGCRFFVHLQCAKAETMTRFVEKYTHNLLLTDLFKSEYHFTRLIFGRFFQFSLKLYMFLVILRTPPYLNSFSLHYFDHIASKLTKTISMSLPLARVGVKH